MLIRKITISILLCSTLAVFLACDEVSDNSVIIEKINFNLENRVMGENSKTEGDAHSGQFFSRINDLNPFGIGYTLSVPKSATNKNIKIIIEGWARTNIAQSKATIVVSLNQRDSLLSWNPIWINGSITEPNKWCFFKDSMLLPSAPKGTHITSVNVFGYLNNSPHENFDVDDFIITFKEN